MKCNYKKIECPYRDTGGDCESCEHYGKGIKETGATPVLAELIEMIKKIWYQLIRL